MGELRVAQDWDGEKHRRFMKRLLNDLAVLERALQEGIFETDLRRIGAEQEFFLVDDCWQPAPLAMEILKELDDRRFTTELARFNLEANLDPLVFGGRCLRELEEQLQELWESLRRAASRLGAKPLVTGILPTLRKSHMGLHNMTPRPRYYALNDAVQRLRRGDFRIHIKGADEIILRHKSVMLEACNTSFQVHFQVAPKEFAELYNVAQLVTAPLLAVSVNSPLLFGKRLWRETRIALFQQSIDTRNGKLQLREIRPRVSFGSRWVDSSVLEIFREDVSRFRSLLCLSDEESEPSESEGPPQLKALRLHNGTVYRWNRACYGISDGKPHLRIESRAIPAGPSIRDQVANAAFFFGLMCGVSSRYEDIPRLLDFKDAHQNFLAAARYGLAAQFRWLDQKIRPAQEMILDELIPLARDGLLSRGIDGRDADAYMEVVERRAAAGCTGAQWMSRSLAAMGSRGVESQRMAALVSAVYFRQKEGKPVHEWPNAEFQEGAEWKATYGRVEQFMTTDLFTVQEDETIGFVANLMDWQRIRHVPVEDRRHRLVGLISYRSLLRFFARMSVESERDETSPVTTIMKREPLTVAPETPTLEAIQMMTAHQIGCLPVVKKNRLVGIITERDFMRLARKLVERELR